MHCDRATGVGCGAVPGADVPGGGAVVGSPRGGGAVVGADVPGSSASSCSPSQLTFTAPPSCSPSLSRHSRRTRSTSARSAQRSTSARSARRSERALGTALCSCRCIAWSSLLISNLRTISFSATSFRRLPSSCSVRTCHQWSSVVIRGHQWSSVPSSCSVRTCRGARSSANQRSSAIITGHHWWSSLVVISRNQPQSSAISAPRAGVP